MKKVNYAKITLEDGETRKETDVPMFFTEDIDSASNLAIVNLEFLKDIVAGLPKGDLSILKGQLHDIVSDADSFKQLDEAITNALDFQRITRAIQEYNPVEGGLSTGSVEL